MDRKLILLTYFSVRRSLCTSIFVLLNIIWESALFARIPFNNSAISDQAFNYTNRKKIAIYAIGDVIPHIPIKKAADAVKDYNFFFNQVSPQWQNGDLVFANLETVIDEPQNPRLIQDQSVTAWPGFFFAPPSLITAIKTNGITTLSIANNHILDYGNQGLISTLYHLDKNKIDVIGILRRPLDPAYLQYSINGVKIAFIGYTVLMNLLHPVTKIYPQVNYLQSKSDLIDLLTIIKTMKEKNDFVIISLHWGDEYKGKDLVYTKALAQLISDAGADLILGHHPHVLQPVYWLQNQNNKEKKTLVVSSIGNFLANQGYDLENSEAYRKRLSALFRFTFSYTMKKNNNKIEITDKQIQWNYYPVWIKNSWMMAGGERVSIIQPIFLRCAINEMDAQMATLLRKTSKDTEISLQYINLLLKNYIDLMRAQELANQTLGQNFELEPKCSLSLLEDSNG